MDSQEIERLRSGVRTERQGELLRAIEEHNGVRPAARATGMAPRNAYRMIATIRANLDSPEPEKRDFTALPVPDGDLGYDELKQYRRRIFERKIERQSAEQWRSVKFRSAEPCAITVFGDPHLDDDGCNWPQLDEDTQTVIRTPGMYAGSIGDNTNNWIGRLTRLYANQSTTASQAWKLCEGWLNELIEPGKLLFLTRGNHDLWAGSGDPHNWIMRGSGAVDQDWQAQMQFEWPKQRPVRMWASHDFKGHSQYNPLHSHKKKHLWHGAQADIYIAGHRHHWALSEEEDEAGNLVYFARARGYKFVDSFADQLGHGSQMFGASIAFVIQPKRNDVTRIRPFPCVQEAADYLTFLRSA